MNVNDIICLGAEPLALVDYLAIERPRPRLVMDIMKGLQKGAREAGVAIVAGETAIVPEIVESFDLSAAVVGIVRKSAVITGENAKVGDVILGLRSSGIHCNGLTLARKLLLTPKAGSRVARELLRPTRIYVKTISNLLRAGVEIHGLAHITGGAYTKLKRIGIRAKVGFFLDHLPVPPHIFRRIQAKGHISNREMYRTFNMGIGFLIICPKRGAKHVSEILPEAKQVGCVTSGRDVTILTRGRELDIERY